MMWALLIAIALMIALWIPYLIKEIRRGKATVGPHSPIGAGDKLYLSSESGVVTVLKLGEQFEVVASNTFEDQMFVSSPIVAEGDLFLRSKTHLFCISDGKQSK